MSRRSSRAPRARRAPRSRVASHAAGACVPPKRQRDVSPSASFRRVSRRARSRSRSAGTPCGTRSRRRVAMRSRPWLRRAPGPARGGCVRSRSSARSSRGGSAVRGRPRRTRQALSRRSATCPRPRAGSRSSPSGGAFPFRSPTPTLACSCTRVASSSSDPVPVVERVDAGNAVGDFEPVHHFRGMHRRGACLSGRPRETRSRLEEQCRSGFVHPPDRQRRVELDREPRCPGRPSRPSPRSRSRDPIPSLRWRRARRQVRLRLLSLLRR